MSPYLAQHRENPVDWYRWGEEAFERARQLGRPLFVSVGYSACHWCHVMAHESFEDPETASVINEGFVAIKVDREERPDVDALYIEAVQTLTGGAGWPLSVFATPDGRPFYGGTYFPKVRRGNFPAFVEVLDAVKTTWAERRPQLEEQSLKLSEEVERRLTPPPLDGGTRPVARELARQALQRFAETYDPVNGGVGSGPKFPNAPMLELVLRAHISGALGALPMLETTLEAMASGGIYDHLGGGFARYTVDGAWVVPHFEKMLYDQVSLARLYLRAFLATGDDRWRQVVTETLDYVLRDLALTSGGIASAEDADSQGEEGRFYTWTRAEIEEVLGAGGAAAARAWYGLDAGANFEHGRFILLRPERGLLERPAEIEAARAALFAARATRVRPGRDDKVLTEWNAMAVSVLAEAAGALDEPRYGEAALAIAEFLCRELRGADGRWQRSFQQGVAQHLAVAGDYAWLIEAFVRLAEHSGRAHWLDEATALAGELDRLFSAEDGGLYITGSDATDLVVRPRDSYDGVLPATTSVAAGALARLGALTGEEALTARARRIADSVASALVTAPLAFSHLIGALALIDDGALEIVVAGTRPDLVAWARHRYLPTAVLAWGERTASPLWEGREEGAFVCHDGVCMAPAYDETALGAAVVMAAFRPEMPT